MTIQFTYLRTPLYRYTFKNRKIREWVEAHCEGMTLNLFAGETKLNVDEVRNDLRGDMPCEFHMDALDFVKMWAEDHDTKFSTILLDPPYAYRKSMEMYDGAVSSRFNQVKNVIPDILNDDGIVITFGYHSNVMGKSRNFKQEHLLVLSHGGSIHDTLCIIERKKNAPKLTTREIGAFF